MKYPNFIFIFLSCALLFVSNNATSFSSISSLSELYTLCDECDYTRGPDPTESYLEAPSGPFTVDTINVSSSVDGFGGGTIYYPTDTTGMMGAISIVPGFVSPESRIAWWGPRLATHGFVVITITTNSSFDFPTSRGRQLGRALDHVISLSDSSGSPISGMIDENRVAAMGWSMGGGGALTLAVEPRLSAIIPLAPWYSGSNDFDEITAPTMIMGCEDDTTARVSSHSIPFYNTIASSVDKAYMEIADGGHRCANGGDSNDGLIGKYGVSWMKRFIDFDSRYDQFLCGPDHQSDSALSDYRETCDY
jgi:dienelactone hydrolase